MKQSLVFKLGFLVTFSLFVLKNLAGLLMDSPSHGGYSSGFPFKMYFYSGDRTEYIGFELLPMTLNIVTAGACGILVGFLFHIVRRAMNLIRTK